MGGNGLNSVSICALVFFSARMMASPQESAQNQMKEYWEKNQRLQRPNSPWIIYE